MRLRKVTLEALELMEREFEDAASRLGDAGVDVIGYLCTSGSLFRGLDHDMKIVSRIEDRTGIPAVATSGAVVKALKALKVKKLAVATPYVEEINHKEREFLVGNGFQIVDFRSLGIEDNLQIGRLQPSSAYNIAKKLSFKEADGCFISCTNFRTIEMISRFEKIARKPVVTSNTSTLWAMLLRIGLKKKINRYGRLLML